MIKRSEILEHFNAELKITDCDITTVSNLDKGENSLAFCKYDNYNDYYKNLKHAVVLVPDKNLKETIYDLLLDVVIIPVDYPRYRFAELVYKFNIDKLYGEFVLNDSSARRSESIHGVNVQIANTNFGKDCKFYSNTFIGATDFCPIQSPDGKTRLMFPQLGYVKLGDRVEVFPNSIIGRGALSITEVGDDTKIDALCQVGHNCKVGRNCMITAGCILAGSVTMGDNVFVGIGSMIRNGVHIGNNVTIGQGSNVVKDIPDNAIVMGNPAKVVGWNEPEHNATQVP